jgi:restriction endonuclease S subunit
VINEPILYWVYVLQSIVYDPWISGSAQPKLTKDNLGNISLPLPPPEDRLQIVSFLSREASRLDALIAKVREAIEKLKEYRTALISAAVTGKIDVRNS